MMYNGPHLCRVLQCLAAGNKESAASWMERDIGEYSVLFPNLLYPMPESLREVEGGIEYTSVSEAMIGIAGEGI